MRTIYNYIKAYLLNARKIPFSHVVKIFPKWFSLLGKPSLSVELPWITFRAIDYLDKYLKPDMKVFEYGSGGSTIYFSKKCDEVVSVEHNKEWYEMVVKTIAAKKIRNTEVLLAEPIKETGIDSINFDEPSAFNSSDENFSGYSFREYVEKIHKYPKGYFDVVVVDGRSRPSCYYAAIEAIRPGGIIIFDNTERESYHRAIEESISQKKVTEITSCYGPLPYSPDFSETTIFKRI
jgi:hypothetical protein